MGAFSIVQKANGPSILKEPWRATSASRIFFIIIIIIIIWSLITHFRINNELQCVYIQSQI